MKAIKSIASADAALWAALAAAGALALLQWGYFPAGYFHDDSIYWLLSRSLAEGRYTVASDPGGQTLVNYLPGYPLALALLAWMGDMAGAQALSFALTLGSVALAWRLFHRALGPAAGLCAGACFAVQPLLLRYGTTALSEPLFVFLTLAAFTLNEDPARKRDPWLAFAAGFACLVRTAGVFLAAALLVEALWKRNLRRALFLAAALALFQGGLTLWTASHGQGASAFLAQWRFALSGAPEGTARALMASNAAFYAEFASFMALLPLGRWGRALEGSALGGALQAVLLGGVLWGAVRLWRQGRPSWALYALGTAALTAAWLRPDPRYLLPLLFPLIAFFFAAVGGASARRRAAAGALAAVMVAGALAINGRAIAARAAGSSPRLPEAALAAAAALPPDAVVAGNLASTVYVRTGRRGTDFLRTYDPAEFLAHLAERGVTHVLLDESVLAAGPERPDVNDWTAQAWRMVSNPAWYRRAGGPVRPSPSEDSSKGRPEHGVERGAGRQTGATASADGAPGWAVFEVRAERGRFLEAYGLYRDGKRAQAGGALSEAAAAYAAAAARDPGLTDASGRLAQLAAARNDWREASRLIRRALAVWPSDPGLLFHAALAESRLTGRPPDLAAAKEAALRTRFWPLIWRLR